VATQDQADAVYHAGEAQKFGCILQGGFLNIEADDLSGRADRVGKKQCIISVADRRVDGNGTVANRSGNPVPG
jgi:hypothetical protein